MILFSVSILLYSLIYHYFLFIILKPNREYKFEKNLRNKVPPNKHKKATVLKVYSCE